MLYKKLVIPNFEDIRNELEISTSDNVKNNVRYWDMPYIWFKDNAPLFYEFIESRRKTSIRLCRFYLTPAYGSLRPHIDGLTTNKSPIGFNIPIIGYKNSYMNWYESPNDNLVDGNFGFNNIYASRVINLSRLTKIDSIEIDCPTFVRTDIVHGVENNNSTVRLILSLRFPYTQTYGQNFDDTMDLTGLD